MTTWLIAIGLFLFIFGTMIQPKASGTKRGSYHRAHFHRPRKWR